MFYWFFPFTDFPSFYWSSPVYWFFLFYPLYLLQSVLLYWPVLPILLYFTVFTLLPIVLYLLMILGMGVLHFDPCTLGMNLEPCTEWASQCRYILFLEINPSKWLHLKTQLTGMCSARRMVQSVWVILYKEYGKIDCWWCSTLNNVEWTIYITNFWFYLSYFVQDVMERLVKADVNKYEIK